ncbi:integrase family protein [Ralstonia pseudosolanacearum]|uniref:tyrosine-type recombinase/integrase n=1 Tax=Ralstonia pseudosolanacearum TaxID=1310165 RepID=UPI00267622F1|nr:integrase family protein [Ralstonia pseudosolanacearum]MDO3621730.1 integrase family protein [Ralstonia pseudosolanacearum]
MAKINFTAKRVHEFTCPTNKKQAFLWDASVPGLGLRATSGGAKAYIFQGEIHRQTARLTLGDTRAWTLDNARVEARRLQTAIDAGRDPRVERVDQLAQHEARQAAERRKTVIVAEAWQAYLNASRAKWSERHYRDHVNLARAGGEAKMRGKGKTSPGPLASLMVLKLSELTAERVSEWLVGETQTRPTNTEQSYRKLRAFVRWCEEKGEYVGLVPAGAYSARVVREAVPKTKAKNDCLQREQLSLWFGGVRAIPNSVISAYLQSLLITGARREELAALRWEDVDFRWRSLTMNDKVEGTGGRAIPLTPYLATLLQNLKQLNEMPPNKRQLARLAEKGEEWAPSPWVFASKTSEDGKIAEPRIAHNKALAAAELPHLTLHGLRRSFGTLSEWVEVPVGVVAQIQGHKPSAIAEKHYRRRPIDLLRVWHDKIELWMLEQAGIPFNAKVT